MALIDKTTLKAWLRITTTTEDALLDDLCAQAEKKFLNQISRIIESANVAETRNGRGRQAMMLREYPVTSVAGVSVNGVTIPVRTSVTGYGYVTENVGEICKLSLVGYTFTEGTQNITINYAAGYATVPDDIKLCLRDTCAYWYRGRERIGEKSKNLGDQVVMFMTDETPPIFDCTVNNYKRVYLLD